MSDKINSAYLLQGIRDQLPTVYNNASRLLMISDILNYYLTGTMVNEPSMLSTTQLYDSASKSISKDICQMMGLRPDLIGDVSIHGEMIGYLRQEIMEELQLTEPIPVVSVPSHDTASAVLAVPANRNEKFAFISSGTWSLLGMELESALINSSVFDAGFTNEVGGFGTITLLQNGMGLFLLQQLKREYELELRRSCTWDEFYSMRDRIHANQAMNLFNVNAREFFNPVSMLDAILTDITKHGVNIPSDKKWQIAIEAALQSLACSYAVGVEQLEKATGNNIDKIYIVGGGTRDKDLNQLTANRTGRSVLLGSAESTSLGNIIAQTSYLNGYSVEQMRETIRRSFPPEEVSVEPVTVDAVNRYRSLIE